MASNDEKSDRPEIDWHQVWQANSRWLRRVLFARLGRKEDVEDVFQEMALTVSRKPDKWPHPEKLQPWLYRVTIRQVCMFHRKRSREQNRVQAIVESDLLDVSENPFEQLMRNETSFQTCAALSQLNGPEREILVLKHVENWSYEQISKHTGISRDKVIYRVTRARKKFKTIFEQIQSPEAFSCRTKS